MIYDLYSLPCVGVRVALSERGVKSPTTPTWPKGSSQSSHLAALRVDCEIQPCVYAL